MELKEFIKTAVTDITGAISELQGELENGAIINPTIDTKIENEALHLEEGIVPIEHLNFDIAVTAIEASGIEGGAKAGISVFGAKVGTESSSKTENVSRISFSIPIVLPFTHVESAAMYLQGIY